MRRRLLDQTKRMAEDFRAGNPNVTWRETEMFLGVPTELARTMLECEDQRVLIRYRKIKNGVKRGFVFSLVLALIAVSCSLAYVYLTREKPLSLEIETVTVIYAPEPLDETPD